MRRVVTGQRADGKSVFVSDEVLDATSVSLLPGSAFCQLWGSDDVVSLPTDGTEPAWRSFFPPSSGFRFLVWSIPPDTTLPEGVDVVAGLQEINDKLPGLIEFNEVDNPGMHTTATVDLDVVLSGEVWLELDDGAEVHLRAGECVIQNGTRHAWHNRSGALTTILTALVGARSADS
jgi:hypothetical protein